MEQKWEIISKIDKKMKQSKNMNTQIFNLKVSTVEWFDQSFQ